MYDAASGKLVDSLRGHFGVCDAWSCVKNQLVVAGCERYGVAPSAATTLVDVIGYDSGNLGVSS